MQQLVMSMVAVSALASVISTLMICHSKSVISSAPSAVTEPAKWNSKLDSQHIKQGWVTKS